MVQQNAYVGLDDEKQPGPGEASATDRIVPGGNGFVTALFCTGGCYFAMPVILLYFSMKGLDKFTSIILLFLGCIAVSMGIHCHSTLVAWIIRILNEPYVDSQGNTDIMGRLIPDQIEDLRKGNQDFECFGIAFPVSKNVVDLMGSAAGFLDLSLAAAVAGGIDNMFSQEAQSTWREEWQSRRIDNIVSQKVAVLGLPGCLFLLFVVKGLLKLLFFVVGLISLCRLQQDDLNVLFLRTVDRLNVPLQGCPIPLLLPAVKQLSLGQLDGSAQEWSFVNSFYPELILTVLTTMPNTWLQISALSFSLRFTNPSWFKIANTVFGVLLALKSMAFFMKANITGLIKIKAWKQEMKGSAMCRRVHLNILMPLFCLIALVPMGSLFLHAAGVAACRGHQFKQYGRWSCDQGIAWQMIGWEVLAVLLAGIVGGLMLLVLKKFVPCFRAATGTTDVRISGKISSSMLRSA